MLATLGFLGLLFFACQTGKNVIRFHSEVVATASSLNEKNVLKLINASLLENRDIASASVYHLGFSLSDLFLAVKRAEKMNPEIRKNLVEKISGHLKKLFFLTEDFNLKTLCVQAIAKNESTETLDFLLEILKDQKTGEVAKEQALKEMREFVAKKEDRNKKILGAMWVVLEEETKLFLLREALENVALVFEKDNDDVRKLITEKLETMVLVKQNYARLMVENSLKKMVTFGREKNLVP